MKSRPKVPTGALCATSRPGFGQTKKSVKREYFVLPMSPNVNESIADELMRLGGTETKAMYLPPRYEAKQNVYVVDEVLMKKILSLPFKEYELFYRRGNSEVVYPYKTAEQKRKAKTAKAKSAFKKTQLVTTATS